MVCYAGFGSYNEFANLVTSCDKFSGADSSDVNSSVPNMSRVEKYV